MELYHLSENNLDGICLYPKVPNTYFTKNGYEDNKTKRVCFSPSIENAIRSIGGNCEGLELYVHIPDGEYDIYNPSKSEVPHVEVTNETWIKEKVKLKCVGKIRIDNLIENDISFVYNENCRAEVHDFEWHWLDRMHESVVTEATQLTKKQREDIEVLVCQVLDRIDKSKQNSDFYKERFSKMTDAQFYKYLTKPYPFVFQTELFEIEPTMADINDAAKFMKVPLIEKIALPYFYRNKKGQPVWTKPCLVVYIHHKRVQQMISKKNKFSIDISGRDMKTGRLISDDKGAAMSDREFECLSVMGLDHTMREFAKPKADALEAKSYMYNTISTLGNVSEDDIEFKKTDGMAKNLMSVYLLGCHINSNLVNEGNYTPYTLSERKRKVEREE